jgi:membrane dipeptidase
MRDFMNVSIMLAVGKLRALSPMLFTAGLFFLSLLTAEFAWGQTDEKKDNAAAAKQDSRPPVVVTEAALKVHQASFVFDGHNDLPWTLREKSGSSFDKCDITKSQPAMHTDIPRLKKGNVGAQFWSVFVPAETKNAGTALVDTMAQIEIVHAMVKRYPETFRLCLTYDDILKSREEGKIASLIGMEGGHSIENSLEHLRRLHKLGARYMTLTHSDTLDWADSATDDPKSDGLSPFGEEVVREMNRLGMLVDISHVSPGTMKDALAISKAPIIFSHSSARAVADHPRNVPDDVLELTKKNGGIVMINFFSGFIHPESARTFQNFLQVNRELRKKFPIEADHRAEQKKWLAAHPAQPGSVHDVVDHIEHVIRVAGVDHVGLGSDYDGIGMTPIQLEDVSTYPVITQELLNRGHSEEDIHKIMSGNMMRVIREAEAVSKQLRDAKK